MKIGLIDIDYNGSFPNIALMKLSAWHKSQGDDVEFYMPFSDRYDRVYVSKVFSFSPDHEDCINADEVIYGGTGYHIQLINGQETWVTPKKAKYMEQLPDEVEHCCPDYSLYPKLTENTAYGFLTRGCPRGCKFCHVEAKEGKRSVKVADLREFWRGQKNIVLCDPNILACKDWKSLLQQLIGSKAYVDFNQGLDARLTTKEKAQMLGEIKIKEIHFAWDRYEDKEAVLKGLQIYSEHARRKPHGHNAIVFTIVNFDTNIEQDLERIYTLREMGYWAYVMIYDKEHAHPEYLHLQRWCNNRAIFAVTERYEDYLIR